jgi:hypothetical protein
VLVERATLPGCRVSCRGVLIFGCPAPWAAGRGPLKGALLLAGARSEGNPVRLEQMQQSEVPSTCRFFPTTNQP